MSTERLAEEGTASQLWGAKTKLTPTEDVPEPVTDPWSGIGITGETLEAKVEALEKSNAELEANFDAELEAWRKRLENPELIEPETV